MADDPTHSISRNSIAIPNFQKSLLIGDSRNKSKAETFTISKAHLSKTDTIRKYFLKTVHLSAYQETFSGEEKLLEFASGDKIPFFPNREYEAAFKKILGSLHSQL